MRNFATKAYLENKVLTATPEQLQLMLYDAAIRYAQQCNAAIAERDFERSQIAYERCDAVLCELQRGLRPEIMPEVAENFASLYTFCQSRLDEGNIRHDTRRIDEAIGILRNIRQSWLLLIEKLANEATSDSPYLEPSDAALAVET